MFRSLNNSIFVEFMTLCQFVILSVELGYTNFSINSEIYQLRKGIYYLLTFLPKNCMLFRK